MLKFDGTTLTEAMADGNPALALPVTMNGFYGPEFAVNGRGDLASFGYSRSDRFLAVRQADGTDTLVVLTTERSPENDWFINFTGAGMSDTGIVYFTGGVWNNGQRQITLTQCRSAVTRALGDSVLERGWFGARGSEEADNQRGA